MKQQYGRIPYMAVIRPPPPPTLHTFLLRHTVNTLLIKFEHNDSDQNGNSAGNMTLQERKKNICSSTMDLSTGGTPSYHHPIACLQ